MRFLLLVSTLVAAIAVQPSPISPTLSGSVVSVQTDKHGARFAPKPPLEWTSTVPQSNFATLSVNRSLPLQNILGFGSALTESAAFNYHALSPRSRKKLVEALWAPPPAGNGYTMGRMHMNSADYSLESYSLDDQDGDYDLAHFDDNLTHDSKYVLPLVRDAHNAADGLQLFFSPWSPPGWLKKNKNMTDTVYPNGLVDGRRALTTWANYFIRFAHALKKFGVPAWGATLQNEPLVNMKKTSHVYESCAWTAESQGEFLAVLGRLLANESDLDVASLKLFGYDWNRKGMADWTNTVLKGPGGKYLAGVTHHWYAWNSSLQLEDIEALPKGTLSFGAEASLIKHGVVLQRVEQDADSKPWGALLDTDGAKTGTAVLPDVSSVRYTYAVGELYLLDILGTIRAGSSAWVEWNAFLDYSGGPNHIGRTDIGAPVIIDASTDSVFLQSPYYYMGHLSRFVKKGARRIACGGDGFAQSPADHDRVKSYISPQITEGGKAPEGNVPLVAGCFLSADDTMVAVVVMNVNEIVVPFTLSDMSFGKVNVAMDPHSVRTFSYSISSATVVYV